MRNFLSKHKTILGILVSAIFVWLSLSKVNFSEVGTVLSNGNPLVLIGVIFIAGLGRFILALRWKKLLTISRVITVSDTFHFTNIGYLLNNLFPARMGDFVKAFLLAKKRGLGRADIVFSVVVERLFDLLGMGFLFLVAIFLLKLPNYAFKGGIILLLISFISFLFLILVTLYFDKVKLSTRINNKHRILQWILAKGKKLSIYGKFLHNISTVLTILFLTLIVWVLYLYSGFIVINDMHPSNFSWQTSMLSLLFVSVSFIIPSTPGNLGVYQYACILAFQVADVGYSKEEALVFSLFSQLPVYLLTIVLGIISMISENLNVFSLKRYSDSASVEIKEND